MKYQPDGYHFIIAITILISMFFYFNNKENSTQKSKPHQQFGEKIVKQGQIFDRQIASYSYTHAKDLDWSLYCPAIHNRPKNYGKPKKR